jgi:hypothetical protein
VYEDTFELISYEDSDANRITSGYPGLYFNAAQSLYGSASPAWVNGFEVENWDSGAAVDGYEDDFTSVGWNKLSPP